MCKLNWVDHSEEEEGEDDVNTRHCYSKIERKKTGEILIGNDIRRAPYRLNRNGSSFEF